MSHEPAQHSESETRVSRFGRASLWMGIIYTIYYAGIACWGPYITLYYKELGLSGIEIGILAALPALAMAFLAPLWGMLADLWNIHRLILRGALIAVALAVVGLSYATTFGPILLMVLLMALFGVPVSPILDSYAVAISKRSGISFGQLRVWGSVGYTITAWAIGWFMGGLVSAIFLSFYAIALVLTCLVSVGLPAQRISPRTMDWHGAAALLRNRSMIVLLSTIVLVSVSTSSMMSFFGIYLKELGGSATLVGTASAVAALSELPIMAFGRRLEARLGAERMFVLSILIYAIRLVVYSLLSTVTWILPIQLLQGVSFGLYLMSSVALIHQLVGPELGATAQGLLSSALSFGQITGALGGGALMDHIGVIGLYRIGIGIILIALAIYVFGFRSKGSIARDIRARY